MHDFHYIRSHIARLYTHNIVKIIIIRTNPNQYIAQFRSTQFFFQQYDMRTYRYHSVDDLP